MFGGHILNGFRDIQLFSEGGRGRERGSKAYELEVWDLFWTQLLSQKWRRFNAFIDT